ncbi:unnamed protein product [Mesocestoides corti]|uniref:Kinesin motor domain-containing protein n=1 Tax=Mesocestoides corti TaxID=53468 RepID=A0A0R3U5M5_MESCO|nr:unnamed protein product [Mesocestoides corti]
MSSPRRLRRSPFSSTTSSTTAQRFLDNHANGSAVLVGGRHVQQFPTSPQAPPNHVQSQNLQSSPCDSAADFEEIREKLIQANLLAERANALASEQRSNTKYLVSLQVPIHCLNQAKRKSRQLQCEPVIELHSGGVRVRSMSLARMQDNLRDLESNRGSKVDAESSSSSTPNQANDAKRLPLWPTGSHQQNADLVLIGVANLYFRCLLFVSEFSYSVPILNPQGEIFGRVLVELLTAIRSEDRQPDELLDVPDPIDREQSDFGGNVLEVKVTIREATGIPNSFSRKILCHYQMLGHEEPVVVLPKPDCFAGYTTTDPGGQEYERTQRCTFDHTRCFQLPLARETLKQLAHYALSIEVYGNLQEVRSGNLVRRMTSNRGQLQQQQHLSRPITTATEHQRATSPQPVRTMKLRRYKSDLADRRKPALQTSPAAAAMNGLSSEAASRLAEDWLKVQRRIDFWVAIEELMEDVSTTRTDVLLSACLSRYRFLL